MGFVAAGIVAVVILDRVIAAFINPDGYALYSADPTSMEKLEEIVSDRGIEYYFEEHVNREIHLHMDEITKSEFAEISCEWQMWNNQRSQERGIVASTPSRCAH